MVKHSDESQWTLQENYSIKILARNNSKQIKILVIKECNLVSFSLADFLKLMHLAYSINNKSLMLVENY